MSEAATDDPSSLEAESSAAQSGTDDQRMELLGLASAGLAAISFLTLLRLADRQDRTPLRALGLFFATTTESVTATALGARVLSQRGESDHVSRGLVLGAAGTVLGVITTLLNFNWMRTRRRL